MKIISLFTLSLSLILYSCSFGDGDILIIPKNFKGYIVIIYDQKSGILPKRKGMKTIYEIPANGILKVQTKTNEGWREPNEYYYDTINPKNKLLSYNPSQEISTNLIMGFEGSSGGANKDYEGKDVVRFTFHYIGTKVKMEQYKVQADKLDIVKLAD